MKLKLMMCLVGVVVSLSAVAAPAPIVSTYEDATEIFRALNLKPIRGSDENFAGVKKEVGGLACGPVLDEESGKTWVCRPDFQCRQTAPVLNSQAIYAALNVVEAWIPSNAVGVHIQEKQAGNLRCYEEISLVERGNSEVSYSCYFGASNR